jgi:hypothetical protein
MKAIHRRALLAIKALGDDVKVEVLRQRTHTVLSVSRDGVPPRHIALSVSPKDMDHALLGVVRDARRALNQGVKNVRLYKIKASGSLADKVTKTLWVGSKAEGVKARAALYEEGFARKEVVETEVDVPTDKVGLILWLNENAA